MIVSNETPQLEEFSLCILQQNNCFQSDAPILTEPKVPVLKQWRGRPVDLEAARQIFIGHLEDPASAASEQPSSTAPSLQEQEKSLTDKFRNVALAAAEANKNAAENHEASRAAEQPETANAAAEKSNEGAAAQ